MASSNKLKITHERTHGGAVASRINKVAELERSVMACLLWEDTFYESGEEIGERIIKLVAEVCADGKAEEVARIAIEAKRDSHLRHVPLLLGVELTRNKVGRAQLKHVIPEIITRADDIPEFMALYWRKGKCPVAKQVKKHLGEAYRKFDEYQLQKYNGGKKTVKLRDPLRLFRVKPKGDEQAALWKRLIKSELATPDTWEVELSKGKGVNKKDSWTRLLEENKLMGLAMLRNLRNMREAGVDPKLIKAGIKALKTKKLLPINFIAAARHNPGYEPEIEERLMDCLTNKPKLPGKTIFVVDTSGSMGGRLSMKSKLDRRDVAAGLALIARELCEDVAIYCTAGNDGTRKHATMLIPARHGFALSDYIKSDDVSRKIGGGGIFLVQCMKHIKDEQKSADRIIVITDEQDCDTDKNPESADAFGAHNYLINISSNKNGIGYQKWTHISGWSDRVLNYIMHYETAMGNNVK